MKVLTDNQLKAAMCIAAGVSWTDTASQVGVSRPTIGRWAGMPEFKAEVEKRKQNKLERFHEAAATVEQQEVDEFTQILVSYKQARISVYKTKMKYGIEGLQKVNRRMTDLPDEAIAVNNIAALYNTFDNMTENALQGWAEMIGVDTLLRQLGENGTEVSS